MFWPIVFVKGVYALYVGNSEQQESSEGGTVGGWDTINVLGKTDEGKGSRTYEGPTLSVSWYDQ